MIIVVGITTGVADVLADISPSFIKETCVMSSDTGHLAEFLYTLPRLLKRLLAKFFVFVLSCLCVGCWLLLLKSAVAGWSDFPGYWLI